MTYDKNEFINRHPSDIAETIANLSDNEQTVAFLLLPGHISGEVFTYLDRETQEHILRNMGSEEIADVFNSMSPDDRTQIFMEFPDNLIKNAVNLLPEGERKIALTLIGYGEDTVGRMMTPHYVEVKRHWTKTQTLQHIKRFGKRAETLNFIYVTDDSGKLIDDIKIGDLLMTDDTNTIETIMDYHFVSLTTLMTKEEAILKFEKYDRAALPIVSESGILVGIITFDDIMDQVEKRDTEDIQKFGGVEALELPYVSTSVFEMVKKRATWLVILFIGEMFTASAMGYFQGEIEKAIVLALFIPLIISSGGNTGSQAATLIIRAMALNEITLKDWWYVMRKEIYSGISLGLILGVIGFIRIFIWQESGIYNYGEHWLAVAFTVSFSLVGIVLWGTLSGSMIPFVLKRLKLDPATSSAPFVATLVDVTGLIIYFSIAALVMKGT